MQLDENAKTADEEDTTLEAATRRLKKASEPTRRRD
jgi:hypothetical protein